jgi:rhamnulokinase
MLKYKKNNLEAILMSKYYLAIDIGASSGRHILGSVENGKICLEEIYRFENGIKTTDEGLFWDVEALFSEVVAGIAKCREIGKIPTSVAIDTWGVDYVLLDENEKELLPVYAYRDSRTAEWVDSDLFPVSYDELYAKTGIQRQSFNTVYQLYCDKISGRADRAKHYLMMPEYLSYKLTGVMRNEYTEASTTSMVNAKEKAWDREIIEKIGVNPDIFLPLSLPGTVVGELKGEIAERVGFNTTVVLAPSHDTASAVAACPIDAESVYISSGTWSLMGTENLNPVLTKEARDAGFSNEGGAEYRFRFLKNIMGMWLFQNVRKNTDKRYTYDQMMEMAKASSFRKIIDVNHPTLVAPTSMIEAVNRLAGDENLPLGDTLSCIYHSLASMYQKTVSGIEEVTGKKIKNIFIVGGGSRDAYLNELTGKYTGKSVTIGLGEATATGNIISQIMKDENITLAEARKIIKNSFDIKEVYTP